MPEPERPMSGKVCLVTGATSGIGEVTARELASRGATVVLVGRNRERCEASVQRIREQTDWPIFPRKPRFAAWPSNSEVGSNAWTCW